MGRWTSGFGQNAGCIMKQANENEYKKMTGYPE